VLSSLKSTPHCGIALIQRIPERIVFTDASSYAGAGYTVQFSNDIVNKMWTNDEIIKRVEGCGDYFERVR